MIASGSRLLPVMLALLLVPACAEHHAVDQQPAAPVSALAGERIAAVLVAGSDEEPVFDNARRALEAELRRRKPGSLALVSLSAVSEAAGASPATLAGIEEAFARTAPGASACFLFATSHGSRQGMHLVYEDELLTPAQLDAILDRHCADKPTVAILSACFSGVFARPPLPDGNRIIFTAAARDRPSFGCSDDRTYTYFDEALLELLPEVRRWDELYGRLKAEVTRRERAMDERPSLPQASFGSAVPPGELLGG